MMKQRSPQLALAELLRKRATHRSLSAESNQVWRATRGTMAAQKQRQRSLQERFAARLAAIAGGQEADAESKKPRVPRKKTSV